MGGDILGHRLIISENQQVALKNLGEAGLSVDYIGEIFTEIMEGNTEIIYLALDSKWESILKKTADRFGR